MDNIFKWVTENFVVISAILWWIDQGLKLIAPLTSSRLDDNISDILGKLLARFFHKA